ncbi:glycoside hydrolase family 127 protein [Parabacteroides johnsonii]|uniref:glycoside hydrolase family 127 protein n=1 Tax=Parabacteroides johnsonii TaxID=387661 RepID=UPI00242E3369|nr:glycoside hydrolase family 127 protein [Parabacteroides johnsonii]
MLQKLVLAIGVVVAFSSCHSTSYHSDEPIVEVPFTEVHVTDHFWAPRIEVNRTVSIPSAFRQCEANGRFDNFALAGGLIKGEHKGDFPFDDTDPYKIIEGASYSLAVKYDPNLDAYLDSVITLIGAAQEPDGYLTTCVTNKCERLNRWWGTRRWEKLNSHELYNSGHLYEAAVAHYQATGKRSLLDVAIKNADLVCKDFGPDERQKHVPSGHPIIEMGLAKLYKVTGDRKYLDMAKYFVEETGRGTDGHRLNAYSQDHMPILQQEEIVGHAVRAGYLYSGVADVAALTKDTAYFHAICRIWDNMATKKLYITGGIGSRAQGEGFGPEYELHNHSAYCETCASIANVYWNQRMFLATGDAKYIDVLERALYNGVISGVSLSGDKFFYDNPLESMGQHERAPWFGCACCPGNVTRFMASVPKYMYATQGNSLYVNLYVGSESRVALANDTVTLVQNTEYPWDGLVKLTVSPRKASSFSLKLRIPSWTGNEPVPGSDLYTYIKRDREPCAVFVNGTPLKEKAHHGYVVIEREWEPGDVIELRMPMDVRRVKAHEKVRADQGLLAVERGPVVYCLEGVDMPDRHVFNKYLPEDADFTCQYEKEKLNGIVELSTTVKELDRNKENGMVSETEVPVKLIPYSTWNNRGNAEMAVWIPASAGYAKPTPEPDIASRAKSYTIVSAPIQKDGIACERREWCYGVNDQWDPKSSDDMSKPYWYFWLKEGTQESIEYVFDRPEMVRNVQVYWLDFDHYDGNYRVPASWKVQYKAGSGWKDVEAKGEYGCRKDCYNSVDFTPVKTTGLKLVVQLQEGESGGVIEWKVN